MVGCTSRVRQQIPKTEECVCGGVCGNRAIPKTEVCVCVCVCA